MNNIRGFKFKERTDDIPKGHVEIVNITTDGGINISVNFNTGLMELAEKRHLEIMLMALEDAFYRLRPDLREQ
jgi:hypothetical protein